MCVDRWVRLHLSLVWCVACEKHLADVKSMWYIINVGCEIMYLNWCWACVDRDYTVVMNWFERGGKLFVECEKYIGDTI